jgi:diketogulonate reductase-like aldo/keto reductase
MAAVSSSLNLAPVFYGTYKLKPEECREAILTAVRLGYRNFDTAALYKNEADIGDALQESGVARSDLTIIGKLWCNDYHDPRGSCLKSL